MRRVLEHRLLISHRRGFRRGALILLAFVYLFVGVAHDIACLDQAIASDFTISNVLDAGDGGDSKVVPPVCDHCPTCTPCVMPMPAVAADPAAVPVQRIATIAPMRTASHPRLDTPPPKHLI